MATIHVNRAGSTLGTFSLEEVRRGLESGQFLPTDLAWEEGMAEWKPLSQFPGITAAETPPAGGVPIGGPAVPIEAATPGEGPPWENRAELGFFPAMFQTVKEVLLNPTETFAGMKQTGGFGNPLLFYFVLSLVGGLVSMVYNTVLQLPTLVQHGDADAAALGGIGLMGALIVGVVLMPVFIVIGIFVGSGILHLCLMIVGGANNPFETTFRVTAYSGGSTNILQVIPVCGWIIALVWNLVLLVIGLSKAHDTSVGRALFAVLLPVIVCCGLGITMMVMVGTLACVE